MPLEQDRASTSFQVVREDDGKPHLRRLIAPGEIESDRFDEGYRGLAAQVDDLMQEAEGGA